MSGTIDAFLPLFYMAVGALGSLVMWLVLGPVMTGLGVKRLARKAADGDEKSLEFFYDLGNVLIKWAATYEIEIKGETEKVATDKTDDEGKTIYKEIPLRLTPIQLMARSIGQYVKMLMLGSSGGTKAQLKRLIEAEVTETGLGLSDAALKDLSRGKIGRALGELAAPHLPNLINKVKGGGNTQGGSGGW